MPISVINSIVDDTPKSKKKEVKKELESKWKHAEKIASATKKFKKGSSDFYAYVMGIFKKMNPDNFNEGVVEEGKKKKKYNNPRGSYYIARRGKVTPDIKTWDSYFYPAYTVFNQSGRDQSSNVEGYAITESKKEDSEESSLITRVTRLL